jgi:hypothetical protein
MRAHPSVVAGTLAALVTLGLTAGTLPVTHTAAPETPAAAEIRASDHLEHLVVAPGALKPAFNATRAGPYVVPLAFGTSALKITATASRSGTPKIEVKVAGGVAKSVTNGVPSSVALGRFGNTTIQVVVGGSMVYTLVAMKPPEPDATLKSFSITPGTLQVRGRCPPPAAPSARFAHAARCGCGLMHAHARACARPAAGVQAIDRELLDPGGGRGGHGRDHGRGQRLGGAGQDQRPREGQGDGQVAADPDRRGAQHDRRGLSAHQPRPGLREQALLCQYHAPVEPLVRLLLEDARGGRGSAAGESREAQASVQPPHQPLPGAAMSAQRAHPGSIDHMFSFATARRCAVLCCAALTCASPPPVVVAQVDEVPNASIVTVTLSANQSKATVSIGNNNLPKVKKRSF